jgi:hypothetical protein
MRNDETEIIDYVSEYQPDFERLNRAWIELYFSMEPIDHRSGRRHFTCPCRQTNCRSRRFKKDR